ncbi:LysR family transcriptional regulator [Wenxinia marina]|uniref:Transcriptional regulator, LysR family n=1 Tax=Wenxinia marina DSM 24838 TaxID=1123501 RepID=A0A0D0NK27_9RHOB|nr:LysR family transcriptional regulator [Wenxinia marina]KIQ68665.1 transcriptional regulator, LysR family [Wenxinia marina DSM 24838]GGL67759.1 LysR family transcriptional regulator [Wenxinia marina]
MNLAGFDLNLLKVMDALLREGSVTRAGQRLGLSQPAVSAALGRLRLSFGDELFVRAGQGLAPTEFALGLERPLRHILDGIEAMAGATGSWQPEEADEALKISGIDFFAEMLMPQLAARLFAEAPEMKVQFLDLIPGLSFEHLDQHRIDIVLMPQLETPAWVASRPVFRSPFVLIARRGNPRLGRLAEGDTVPLDLFCDLTQILCSPSGQLKAMGDAALEALGRQRRVRMTTPFFSGIVRTVATTDAVALVPAQLARAAAAREGLALYAPPMEVPAPVITMYWHRRTDAHPAHRWLRGLVAEVLAPLNDGLAPLPP